MKRNLSIKIKNELVEISRLAQLFEEFQEFHNLSSKAGYVIQLALDEIITNIISYGYEDDYEHEIEVIISLNEEDISLCIKDDGHKFNPLKDYRSPVDTESSLGDRPIGGMGLHLVKNLMDEIHYKYEDKYNTLLLKKRLN